MCRILFFVFSLLLNFNAYNQAPKFVELLPYWEEGTTRKYVVKMYAHMEGEQKAFVNIQSKKEINIQVVKYKRRFIEMNWKINSISVLDSAEIDPLVSLSSVISEDISINYRIDKNGNFIKATNLEAIEEAIQLKVEKAIAKKNTTKKLKPNDAEIGYRQFYNLYTSKNYIDAVVLSEIKKFHQLYGCPFKFQEMKIIPDEVFFPPMANEVAVNNLELKYTHFDSVNQLIYIEGILRSVHSNKRMNEFLEKGRTISYAYTFNYPENWLVAYKETLESEGEFMDTQSVIEINFVE